MAARMSGLKRSPSGAYGARKVIPKDVRVAYASRFGLAWEEKFYLSSAVSEHEAKARFGEWLAEIETRVAQLRARNAASPLPLTRREAHGLAGRWYVWFIEKHEQDICTPGHWKNLGDTLIWDVIRPQAPIDYEMRPTGDRHWDWKARPDVRNAIRPAIAAEAKTANFLAEQAISLTPNALDLFNDAVGDNLMAAFSRLESIARGNYAADENVAAFPEYLELVSPRSAGRLKVIDLFKAWADAVKPANSTVDRWSVVFNAADKHFLDAHDIDFVSAKAWMNGLADEGRSAKTVATVWRTALKTVFAWGANERLIKSNPFRDVRISVPRQNIERETKAFTPEEARLILIAASQCDDTQSYDERARRWVPWICAYSGARAGEIAQLRGADIYQRNEHYFARLTPSAGRIKTRRARSIPIHEHLLAQGFLTFVERAKGGPLFYRRKNRVTTDGESPRQTPSERLRGRLGSWVRSLGITDPELSPNHAWRHTFKAQAARAGMDERYSDAITGHAPASMGRAYTKPLPEDLAEAIKIFPRYRLDDSLVGKFSSSAATPDKA